ncbi:MAG: hypothetical protein K2M34_04205 [Alphaproteobacteria bacterium]|nr:hypothetical protein [Alphaproteobacteria bacterium]
MKHLTDDDIQNMADAKFTPDINDARCAVRQLHLAQKIPKPVTEVPHHVTLDLHQRTEQESWDAIMEIATSGVRRATIITGASGILKIKFQQWARDSILSPYIISATPLNNGSFDVRFRKH